MLSYPYMHIYICTCNYMFLCAKRHAKINPKLRIHHLHATPVRLPRPGSAANYLSESPPIFALLVPYLGSQSVPLALHFFRVPELLTVGLRPVFRPVELPGSPYPSPPSLAVRLRGHVSDTAIQTIC